MLAPPCRNGERRRQHGSAHAEAQDVDLLLAGDRAHRLDGIKHATLDVVIPGRFVDPVGVLGHRIAPRNQEHGEPFSDRVTHERILGLQIEDVKLVDARRHQKNGALVNRGCGRLVLDDLQVAILVDHRSRGGREVLAYGELALIGLGDPALFQVAQEVRNARPQGFAAGFDERALRIRVGGEEVGRGHGVDPLHDGKLQAILELRLGIRRSHHLLHRVGRQQIHVGHQQVRRARRPGFGG